VERVTDANENILEVFENDIEYYLQEFAEKQNIDDFRSVPQSVWNGALRYIYNHVFKPNNHILKCHDNYNINNNNIQSNFNMYNYNTVLDIADYYIYNMCMVNNKEVSILGFSTLTGIDESIIYDWGNGSNKLSPTSAKIYKKLSHYREESLANKLADGKQNPVGVIAMLNRHYGWASPYTADARKQQGALSAAELPKLGNKMSVSGGLLADNCVADAQIKED
jgi:hypothetical protein